MDYKFQVGDRVCCANANGFGISANKKFGTILHIDDRRIGIAFDEDINGHDLSGRCDHGHGWWFIKDDVMQNFELIENDHDFEIDEDAWKQLIDDFTKKIAVY